MPSHIPTLRQLIPGITLGLCFLGHPPCQGIRPGRLLPFLREHLTGYSVPCVHLRGFRVVLYAGFLSSECLVNSGTWPETLPFWAGPFCRLTVFASVGRLLVTTPHPYLHFRYPWPPAQRCGPVWFRIDRLSSPLLTIVCHSLARGWCCLPSTWRIGIDALR